MQLSIQPTLLGAGSGQGEESAKARSRSPRRETADYASATYTSFKATVSEVQREHDLLIILKDVEPLNMPRLHAVLGYEEQFKADTQRLRIAKDRKEFHLTFQQGETITVWMARLHCQEASITKLEMSAAALTNRSENGTWLELFAGIGGSLWPLRQ